MRRLARLCCTLVVAALAVSAAPSRVAAQTAVTFCGQEFAGDGVLAADLDCTGFTSDIGAAVLILKKGRLDLNGHTLKGANIAVGCFYHCEDGHYCGGRRCEVSNGTIDGSTSYAFFGAKAVTVKNVTITNVGQWAIYGDTVKLTDSTISGSQEIGVLGDSVKLVRTSITGSSNYGITSHRVRLLSSSVTGNGIADLSTLRKPHLVDSTCGKSRDADAHPWGVCTAD
jgi:hypothetical protein